VKVESLRRRTRPASSAVEYGSSPTPNMLNKIQIWRASWPWNYRTPWRRPTDWRRCMQDTRFDDREPCNRWGLQHSALSKPENVLPPNKCSFNQAGWPFCLQLSPVKYPLNCIYLGGGIVYSSLFSLISVRESNQANISILEHSAHAKLALLMTQFYHTVCISCDTVLPDWACPRHLP